jgi:glycerol uptake facilitator-like aquaporin
MSVIPVLLISSTDSGNGKSNWSYAWFGVVGPFAGGNLGSIFFGEVCNIVWFVFIRCLILLI